MENYYSKDIFSMVEGRGGGDDDVDDGAVASKLNCLE